MINLSNINNRISSYRSQISSANAEIESLNGKIARLEELLLTLDRAKKTLASDLQANEGRLSNLNAKAMNPKNLDEYTSYFDGILKSTKYSEAEEGLQLAEKTVNDEIEKCRDRIHSLNIQIDGHYSQITYLNKLKEEPTAL